MMTMERGSYIRPPLSKTVYKKIYIKWSGLVEVVQPSTLYDPLKWGNSPRLPGPFTVRQICCEVMCLLLLHFYDNFLQSVTHFFFCLWLWLTLNARINLRTVVNQQKLLVPHPKTGFEGQILKAPPANPRTYIYR